MQDGGGVEIPPEFICPLSGHIMLDPILASDGLNYERQALDDWLATTSGGGSSGTGPAGAIAALAPDRVLRQRIDGFLDRHYGSSSIAGSGPDEQQRQLHTMARDQPRIQGSGTVDEDTQRQLTAGQKPGTDKAAEAEEEEEEDGAVDPISLEPIAELVYPAFDLPSDAPRHRGDFSVLFDPKVLSCYLLSTGALHFMHGSALADCLSVEARPHKDVCDHARVYATVL
eukprot:COSAG05_NODE_715_length_7805_cov_5.098235_7_plen_228_part_00